MKIKLLNDGGFVGMELVEFPVEVEAVFYDCNQKTKEKSHYKVSSSELFRVGSSRGSFREGNEYNFLIEEVEVIS
jgi:hypothetical protein